MTKIGFLHSLKCRKADTKDSFGIDEKLRQCKKVNVGGACVDERSAGGRGGVTWSIMAGKKGSTLSTVVSRKFRTPTTTRKDMKKKKTDKL